MAFFSLGGGSRRAKPEREAQVYETVEQHLKKERALKDKGIKVLSL